MRRSKLQPGDEIRVVAASQSWAKRWEGAYQRAEQRITARGYRITFGQNIKQSHRLGTAEAAARAADLQAAYDDKSVKAIWCLAGGWSANELLPLLDWEVIRANPKPLIGYSDITVLLNAVYAKTGQIALLGPNFSTIGAKFYEYTIDSLLDVLSGQASELKPSRQWADQDMKPRRSRPWRVMTEGRAEGVVIGGNLGSFYLLQGTPYQPRFDQNVILAIEDDDEAGKYSVHEFDRRLESILQLSDARQHIKGVLVGRFQPSSKVTRPDLTDIMSRKLGGTIPIISDVDFGHTFPQLTLPIGGKVMISGSGNRAQIELVEY